MREVECLENNLIRMLYFPLYGGGGALVVNNLESVQRNRKMSVVASFYLFIFFPFDRRSYALP